jgi:hypothetical protein
VCAWIILNVMSGTWDWNWWGWWLGVEALLLLGAAACTIAAMVFTVAAQATSKESK